MKPQDSNKKKPNGKKSNQKNEKCIENSHIITNLIIAKINIKLMFQFDDLPVIEIPLKLRDGSDLDKYFLKLKIDNSHLRNIIYFDENGGNY